MHYSFHRRSMLALAALPMANGDAQAAPTPNESTADLTATSMTGRTLRVINPGDAVAMDYTAGRVNIELDEQNRIKRVFIG